LLQEIDRHGSIDLGGFYLRRLTALCFYYCIEQPSLRLRRRFVGGLDRLLLGP
jgi:hypothetical protein